MKKHTSILLFVAVAIFAAFAFNFVSCTKNTSKTERRQKTVVAYVYESFLGEWGAGEKIAELFFAQTGLNVEYVNCGDAAEMLSRAILEKRDSVADVIVGIDKNLASKARNENILLPYKPENINEIDAEIIANAENDFGTDCILTPFDYSHFAMIYDKTSTIKPPASLNDLTKDIYRKKIILMDPRTSSPGLGFVEWTVAAFGEKYEDFWKGLSPNILTMTPSWSSGWGLFSNKEAPLVISYITSAASSIEYENSDHLEALVFEEGHIMQIEGAGILKDAKNIAGAKAFIDFLISEQAQEILPLTQWMFPVNKNVDLPKSFSALPVIKNTIKADEADTEKACNRAIEILNRR